MKYLFLCSLFLVGLASSAWGQKEKSRMIKFSGVIVSSDSLETVAYANIIDKTTETGTISNEDGYFNMIAKAGDTILFTSFGYQSNSYIIPDTLTSSAYYIIHLMTPQTYVLPQVDVYPWPSREQFERAFIEMDPYDGQMRKRTREFSREQVASTAEQLKIDPDQTFNWERDRRQTIVYTQRFTPVNNLMNPAAWAKFVDDWKSGKLQRE